MSVDWAGAGQGLCCLREVVQAWSACGTRKCSHALRCPSAGNAGRLRGRHAGLQSRGVWRPRPGPAGPPYATAIVVSHVGLEVSQHCLDSAAHGCVSGCRMHSMHLRVYHKQHRAASGPSCGGRSRTGVQSCMRMCTLLTRTMRCSAVPAVPSFCPTASPFVAAPMLSSVALHEQVMVRGGCAAHHTR